MYRAKGVEAFKEYSVVTDTPVYETAKQNAVNLSDVSFIQLFSSSTFTCKTIRAINLISLLSHQLHYRYDYNANVKGTNTAPAVTIESERARLANYIQSNVRGCCFILTGYDGKKWHPICTVYGHI